MAVAFDAVGPSSAGSGNLANTSLTWSHTITGSNTVLLVWVGLGKASDAGETTTVTYNGVSMTSLAKVHSGGITAGYGELFGIIAPANAGANVVVTAAGGTPNSLDCGSLSFSGAGQTIGTAFGTPATANTPTSTGTPGITLASNTNGNLIAGFICHGSGINTFSGAGTSRFIINEDPGTTAGGCAAGATAPATGSSVTMTWSATADDFAGVAVEVLPAAGGASALLPHAGGPVWRRLFRHRQVPFPPPVALAGVQPLPIIGQAAPTPGFGTPPPPIFIRSSLQDFATPVTPAPVIRQAAPTPGFGQPNAGQTYRNSLADAPVLTTPAPKVLPPAATPGFGAPQPAIVSQAPAIAAAAPTQATPAPLVVAQQPPAVPPGPAIVSRNSLADAPVLTTPRPVVVMATAVTPYGQPQAAVISQAPAIPAAAAATVTPQPVVVAQAVKQAAAQPPVILRNTLADAPVLTTPRPLVVMTQVRPPPTTTVILSAPFIPPPPPFTIGTLTARDTGAATLTAAGVSSALTATGAGLATLTATDTRTGGPA